MKISELIEILRKELERRGDLEVMLRGTYGSESKTFEIIDENEFKDEYRNMVQVWTDLGDG